MNDSLISVEQAQKLIEGAMESLLDPVKDVEDLHMFFTEDYVQWVDGVELDLTGFLQHARQLKSTLLKGECHIRNLIVSGNTAADIHDVTAIKMNGKTVQVRVIAFFSFRKGKISAVEEMTHLLQGTSQDKDLGSRI